MKQTPISSRKKTHISPQKTQTSIVVYSSTQKKVINNVTPPRTALDRSLIAIMAAATGSQGNSPSSPPKNYMLSNNPYQLLADHEDLEAENDNDKKEAVLHQNMDDKDVSSKVQDMGNSSPAEDDLEDDSESSAGILSIEKSLLSRKAQQVLRRIRHTRKLLLDNSIRDEIESIYGPGYTTSLKHSMEGATKRTSPKDADKINEVETQNQSQESLDVEMRTDDQITIGDDLSGSADDDTPLQQDTLNGSGYQLQGVGGWSDTSTCSTASPTVTSRRVSQPATPGAARVVNQGAANKSLSTQAFPLLKLLPSPTQTTSNQENRWHHPSCLHKTLTSKRSILETPLLRGRQLPWTEWIKSLLLKRTTREHIFIIIL
jgi:hypothetical protein